MKSIRPLPGPSGAAPEFFSAQVSEARRFYLDFRPAARRSLAVVCGGLERTTPDYAIHRAGFPFLSIEYVAWGAGTVKLAGRVHPLEPGRLFCYGPRLRHDIVSDPAAPLVKYFVNFTGARARGRLRDCGLTPGRMERCFPPNALEAIFDELIHCGLRHTARSGALCAGLLECLLLKVADSRAPLAGSEAVAFNTYQRCQRHIRAHFQRLKSLEQIAAECGVNNAHLCRLFRRFDHRTPYQALLRLKMNCAADRLQAPGALVKQVAAELGFADAFHFSRAFKAVFGMSPLAFRQCR